MKLFDKNIKSKIKRKNNYQVRWSTDLRYRLTEYSGQTGGLGAAGGGGGGAAATTRLNVIDPHIVQMLRDVMDKAETAGRLVPNGGAGGGGGGGGGDDTMTGAQLNGLPGATPSDVIRAIVSGDASDGGAGGQGAGGTVSTNGSAGSGGGGAGGTGGAIIIITTTALASIGTANTAAADASPNGNINVIGGALGAGGTAFGGGPGGDNILADGDPGIVGRTGKYIPIVI